MSDEAAKAISQPQEAITFAEFLQSKPPGSLIAISDLMVNDRANGGTMWRLKSPRLELHCDADGCGGPRYFRYISGDRQLEKDGTLSTFISFVCSNCGSSRKQFSLFARATAPELNGECYKHGEMPPFGPVTPPRLLKMLENNRDLFMKGRRCESQGLGIAAFVYYRRVVEEQRSKIIGEISRVATQIGASKDTIETLKSAQNETQFSKSLAMVKDAIPESLLIQGHNPLALLHDNLSNGLHAQTDAECLEIAQAVRVILAELAERISAALKDDAELKKALGKLLNKAKP
jgi:hypothetical protein